MESYKKKLEDLGDLRRQVKLLEEKNTMYMQNTVSLEEELRKANAARSQLETYKRQVKEEGQSFQTPFSSRFSIITLWLIKNLLTLVFMVL